MQKPTFIHTAIYVAALTIVGLLLSPTIATLALPGEVRGHSLTLAGLTGGLTAFGLGVMSRKWGATLFAPVIPRVRYPNDE